MRKLHALAEDPGYPTARMGRLSTGWGNAHHFHNRSIRDAAMRYRRYRSAKLRALELRTQLRRWEPEPADPISWYWERAYRQAKGEIFLF